MSEKRELTRPAPDNTYVRRIRRVRIRQLVIAGASVVAAVIAIYEFSPESVGGWAYYMIIALLLLNAVLALLQSHQVIRPIAMMLRRLQQIADDVADENFTQMHRGDYGDKTAFSYLATSMDNLIDTLLLRMRVAVKKAQDDAAQIRKLKERVDETLATLEHAEEQKRRQMCTMAASIAHDTKNVFAALQNIVAVLRASSDPNVLQVTPLIEDVIQRGTRLMGEMATMAGETRYQFQSLPASKALREIAENLTLKSLFPSNVRFHVDIPEDGLPEVDFDLTQAWKVSFNIVKNAIEAMGLSGGRIWFRAYACEMTAEMARGFRHSGNLRLGRGIMTEYVDDGPGIPPALLSRLFDPYVSSKGEGHGLGLATTAAIVDAHAGAICVVSQRGQGTRFSIFLPASRQNTEEIAMMREIAPNGEILLVDDDPAILKTTALVLRLAKIAAHPAATPEDALRKLRALRSRIRAVLVDAHLGSVSSVGLLRIMRAEYPETPIILTSGANEDAVRKTFDSALFDRFLPKPYAARELTVLLKELAG